MINLPKEGDVIGEHALLTGRDRAYCAVSQKVSHVVILKQSDLLEVIKSHPKDYVLLFIF
jgi:CRP-like cAMP-binding protein